MFMQKVPQLLFATSQARLVPVFTDEIEGSTDFCHEAGVLAGHPRWSPSAHLRDSMLQYYARKSPEVFHPFANVMSCLQDDRFSAASLQESRQQKLRSAGRDDTTQTLSCGLSTRQAWINALLSGNREATEALKALQPGDAVPLNDLPPELLSFRNSAAFNAAPSNAAGERRLTAFEHRVTFNDSTERFTISGNLTDFFATVGRKVNVVILQREARRVFTNETMEALLQTWESLTAQPMVEGEGGRALRSFADSATVSVVKPSGRISEQAALFLQADIVVAASGAGNSWAVFMQPGTVYIEVSPFRMCGALDDGLNRVRNRGLFSGGVFRWAGVNHIATVQRASTELSRHRSGVHAASVRVSRARFAVVAQLALLVLANPVTAFVSEFPLGPESAMDGETTVEAAHLKPCN
ncbi:hypothetical protein DIPPA_33478 [Diplonema papillatum]|nr:hypothetical protein DIPPA_33478 [Diplonema papillatum]